MSIGGVMAMAVAQLPMELTSLTRCGLHRCRVGDLRPPVEGHRRSEAYSKRLLLGLARHASGGRRRQPLEWHLGGHSKPF